MTQGNAPHDKKRPQRYDNYGGWAAGIGLGVLLGVILGLSMQNIALGIGLGLPIGVAFGILFQSKDFEFLRGKKRP